MNFCETITVDTFATEQAFINVRRRVARHVSVQQVSVRLHVLMEEEEVVFFFLLLRPAGFFCVFFFKLKL